MKDVTQKLHKHATHINTLIAINSMRVFSEVLATLCPLLPAGVSLFVTDVFQEFSGKI